MMDLHNQELLEPQADPEKPAYSGKISSVLIHLAIAITGCLVMFFCTGSMQKHMQDLRNHFSSGSWEVSTDQAAVETSLRAQYGDSRKWSIRYVGGTSNSFPLAGPY